MSERAAGPGSRGRVLQPSLGRDRSGPSGFGSPEAGGEVLVPSSRPGVSSYPQPQASPRNGWACVVEMGLPGLPSVPSVVGEMKGSCGAAVGEALGAIAPVW